MRRTKAAYLFSSIVTHDLVTAICVLSFSIIIMNIINKILCCKERSFVAKKKANIVAEIYKAHYQLLFFLLKYNSYTNIILVSGIQHSDLTVIYIRKMPTVISVVTDCHHINISQCYWLYSICCTFHPSDSLI